MKGDFQGEKFLLGIKRISIDMEIRLNEYLESRDMSGTQVYFMVYILRHHPDGTYITQICREVGVSKATISALVKKLREKGYLCFAETPGDIRKKKIMPTEKLMAEGMDFLKSAESMENDVCSVLDCKEREILLDLEQKILTNISRTSQKKIRTQEVIQ